MIEQVRNGTSAEYELTDEHWKLYKRKRPRGRPARRWRDELDDYWKGTIWQRIAQDRQMWKRHASPKHGTLWLHNDDDNQIIEESHNQAISVHLQ